jgi:hypothetical protein
MDWSPHGRQLFNLLFRLLVTRLAAILAGSLAGTMSMSLNILSGLSVNLLCSTLT